MADIRNRGNISASLSNSGSITGGTSQKNRINASIKETLLKGDKGDPGPPGPAGKEPSRIYVDENSCLNIEFNDGTSFKSDSIRGQQGVGIQNIEVNGSYGLKITMSDGTVINTDSIRGEKGDDGNGIASATLNNDYTLTLTWTDGNSYTTPFSIRGAQGDAYVLTAEDKEEIYERVLEDYPAVEEVDF